MTSDPTAPDPVSEARREIEDVMLESRSTRAFLLDAFASAVRADERARMRERIEAMPRYIAIKQWRRKNPDGTRDNIVNHHFHDERKHRDMPAKVVWLPDLLATLREPETTG